MNKKKITTLSLSFIMGLSILGGVPSVFADTAANNNATPTIAVSSYEGSMNQNTRYYGNISYDEFMTQTGYKGNIKGANENELKKLYNEIQSLRGKTSKSSMDAFNKKWDAFDKIINKYYTAPVCKVVDSLPSYTAEDLEIISAALENAEFNNNRFLGDISYDDYLVATGYKGNIPGADQTKLKKLYSEIEALRNKTTSSEIKLLHEKWSELEKSLEKHYVQPEAEYITVKEILTAAGMYDEMSKTDKDAISKVYDSIIALEKAGKTEEASKKWADFDKIYDKYIPTSFVGEP